MASDKRERQRQNRAAKQEELNKAKRRQKLLERVKRVATWAVVFAGLVIVANAVWG